MSPDFNKSTIDTLAKRAAYLCSNPDCRVSTIGPNSAQEKSTKIGEAAHIYGARPGSKRYMKEMSPSSRSEITNAIWLCRNCHKLIDSDDELYTPDLLFNWRELHEEFVLSNLGTHRNIDHNEIDPLLDKLKPYPPIIKRIIVDKPNGWELSIMIELMKLNGNPKFQKLIDLQNGLYLKPIKSIPEEKAFNWLNTKLSELSKMVPPVIGLLEKLNQIWEKSDLLNEIFHFNSLYTQYLDHVIDYEESIKFVRLPDQYNRALDLLQNQIGSQVQQLSSIVDILDENLTSIRTGIKVDQKSQREFVFNLSKNFEREFSKELEKLRPNQSKNDLNDSGCLIGSLLLFFTLLAIFIFS